MEYLSILFILFISLLVYFKIADRYNIIDRPNHRNAHNKITLRGGGVIFPIAFLLFLGNLFFNENSHTIPKNYLIFGMGLLVICIISFIDDIVDLSIKIRLIFHFISATLLLVAIDVFQVLPIWAIPLCYIFIIGILNAFNFMDGINGISGIYSLVVLSSFLYVNNYLIHFVDIDFIIYPITASAVFLFFNFRKKAKCFLGDIGSLGIAFWIIALIGLLIIKTGQYKWILFLSVYGVETILTIFERIKLKENIFEAHRRHLYQIFTNDKKASQLVVSSAYAVIQFLINVVVICSDWLDWINFLVILLPSIFCYLFIKTHLKKQIVISNKIKNEN